MMSINEGYATWEKTKFAKFPGGHNLLEAHPIGPCLSAFGTKKYSPFSLKRGWNLCPLNLTLKLD